MLLASPKYLSLIILLFFPLLFYFRGDLSDRLSGDAAPRQKLSHWAQTVLHDNTSNFEHDGVFDETAEGAPKMTQVSMQFGGNFDSIFERALRTHIENGEKWAYPTHFLRQDIVGKGELAEGVYDKLLYLLTIMVNEMTKPFGKRSEWIVWFDADTVLLNQEIPWTAFLPPSYGIFHDINMLVTADWSGFNAGVFIIRVCEWSIKLLSDAIALPRLKPEIELFFREQDALKEMFNLPDRTKHRIYVPRHWFNVYDEYYAGRGEKVMNGSLIVHFPGMGGARPDAMGRWLDKLDHHPEELRIPFENTTYPAEIDAYWSRLRSGADQLGKAEEYLGSVKEDHTDAYVASGKKITNPVKEAKSELEQTMKEEAFDEEKMNQAISKLDGAIRSTKEDVQDAEDKKKKEEEMAAAAKKAEEEKKAKEEAERKTKEENAAKEAAKASQEAKAKEQAANNAAQGNSALNQASRPAST